MSYADKISRWHHFAESKGLKKPVYNSLIDRFLRKIGLECWPTMFWSFYSSTLLYGAHFGILWGTFMYFVVWSDRPIRHTTIPSVAAVIPFGLFMALMNLYSKRKLGHSAAGKPSLEGNQTRWLSAFEESDIINTEE